MSVCNFLSFHFVYLMSTNVYRPVKAHKIKASAISTHEAKQKFFFFGRYLSRFKFRIKVKLNKINFRSESPVSSTCSSPPISPGCEDQNNLVDGFDPHESFKRPIPPEMRQQAFPPHFYNMYQPQLLLPNNSAFHRPDGSGKPMTVSNEFSPLPFASNWIAFFIYRISPARLDSRLRTPSFEPRTNSTSRNFLPPHHGSNG